jgi:hypothetical protein
MPAVRQAGEFISSASRSSAAMRRSTSRSDCCGENSSIAPTMAPPAPWSGAARTATGTTMARSVMQKEIRLVGLAPLKGVSQRTTAAAQIRSTIGRCGSECCRHRSGRRLRHS